MNFSLFLVTLCFPLILGDQVPSVASICNFTHNWFMISKKLHEKKTLLKSTMLQIRIIIRKLLTIYTAPVYIIPPQSRILGMNSLQFCMINIQKHLLISWLSCVEAKIGVNFNIFLKWNISVDKYNCNINFGFLILILRNRGCVHHSKGNRHADDE